MKIYAVVLPLLAVVCSAGPTYADALNIAGFMSAAQLAPLALPDGTVGMAPIGPRVESFQTSFNYDTVSHAISEMNINSNGPLGPYAFTGLTIDTSGITFLWSSLNSIIDLRAYNWSIATDSRPSGRLGGTVPFVLTCTTQACLDDFAGTYGGWENDHGVAYSYYLGPSDSSPISPVPEPSSLMLVFAGAAMLGLMIAFKL